MNMSTKSDLHQQLGQYLQNKRQAAGLTQMQVARKLRYSSPQFVSNFERGLCSPPMKNLRTLVKLYDIDARELIDLIIKEQKQILTSALTGVRRRT